MWHHPAGLDLRRGERNMELAGPLKVTFIAGERGQFLEVLKSEFGQPAGFFLAEVHRSEFVRVIEARADDAGIPAAATVAGDALFKDDNA